MILSMIMFQWLYVYKQVVKKPYCLTYTLWAYLWTYIVSAQLKPNKNHFTLNVKYLSKFLVIQNLYCSNISSDGACKDWWSMHSRITNHPRVKYFLLPRWNMILWNFYLYLIKQTNIFHVLPKWMKVAYLLQTNDCIPYSTTKSTSSRNRSFREYVKSLSTLTLNWSTCVGIKLYNVTTSLWGCFRFRVSHSTKYK